MRSIRKLWDSKGMLIAVILLGIAGRFIVSLRGNNFDLDSFKVVVGILGDGGNVYAETTRYNYGPAWSILVRLMFLAAFGNWHLFRIILIGFLTAVDLGIFTILSRRIGRTVGFLFFLHPISIIITGYHNQFDNLALLTGMLAVLLFSDDYERPLDCRKILALLALGLSLVIKHILFAFPLWLAVKQKGVWQKGAVLLIPIAVFIASFIPYWKDGSAGILQNVLFYRSFDAAPLYGLLVPHFIRPMLSSMGLWLILLAALALVFRRRGGLESLLVYTCVLVAAAPALANQYIAIVVPFVVVHQNLFTWAFTLVGTFHLLTGGEALHIARLRNFVGLFLQRDEWLAILAVLLALGFCASLWPSKWTAAVRRVYRKVPFRRGLDE